ncbi:hypothetical protein METHPM2_960010 [Pseudomonas sp. PM2]
MLSCSLHGRVAATLHNAQPPLTLQRNGAGLKAWLENLMEPLTHLLDLTLRLQEVNHANRIYLDRIGGDSAALGTLGDQYRFAQHGRMGDQGVVGGGAGVRAAAGADCVGDVRAQA